MPRSRDVPPIVVPNVARPIYSAREPMHFQTERNTVPIICTLLFRMSPDDF